MLLLASLFVTSLCAEEVEKANFFKVQEYAEVEVTDATGESNIFYNFACNCDDRNYQYVVTARVKPVAFVQDMVMMFEAMSNASDPIAARMIATKEITRLEKLQKDLESNVDKKAQILLSAKDEQGRTAEDILKQKLEGFDKKSSEEQVKLSECAMLKRVFDELRKNLEQKEAGKRSDDFVAEVSKIMQNV